LNRFRDLFDKDENESILHHSAIFLIALTQFMNFFLGQINILVCVFILSCLFCFLKNKTNYDILGGFLLGLGILLRPTLILLIPFVLVISYNHDKQKRVFNLKKSFIRILGSIVLISISGLYFIIYPQMLSDFIEVNLTGEYTYAVDGIEINPSFSLTRIILISLELLQLEINGFLVFFIIALLFLIPILYLHLRNSNENTSIINGFLVGILVILIVYFDSWPHHLVVLMPFLVFFILFNKEFKYFKLFKYLYYLIAFLMVIFWGIFYLTFTFFPFNAGGLTVVILIYIALILYNINLKR
jgi:hypothetical protein